MSTKKEKNIQWANFEKRHPNWKTSIRLHQSGYQEQFGDTQQNAVDTFRPQNDGDVDHTWDGSSPREGVDEAWQGAIDDAILAIKRAIDSLGDDRSVGDVGAGLNQLLATTQALRKLPGAAVIQKAKVNKRDDGTTRPPMVYPTNSESSKAGPRKTITAAELESLPESAKALFEKWQKIGLVKITL
jgi:hypothetical protein